MTFSSGPRAAVAFTVALGACVAQWVAGCSSRSEEAVTVADAGADSAAAATGAPPSCVGTPGGGPTPEPRGDVAGALDPTETKLVVFGGDTAVAPCGDIPGHTHAGDTWLLDVGCGVWQKLDAKGPTARSRHSMAADPARRRALVFGGRTRSATSGPYTAFNDVWAFDFDSQSWAEIVTTGARPAARSNTAVVVDPSGDGQLVVFGGSTDTTGMAFAPKNDTYVLDLATGAWRALAKGAGPTARLFHALTLDREARVVYLVSGGDENAFTGPFLQDVWALDLATESWRKLAPTGTPPAGRINHGLVFDESGKRVLVVGGHDDGAVGNQNEVFALDVASDPPAWKRLDGGDTLNKASTKTCVFAADFTNIDKAWPERRAAFALGARRDGHGLVLFGGKSDCGLLSDAWWFDATTERWTQVKSTPVGLSCLRVSTTCTGLCG